MTQTDIKRLAKRLRAEVEFQGDNDFETTLSRAEWQQLLKLMAQAAVVLEQLGSVPHAE